MNNNKRLVTLLRMKMASEPSFRRAVQEELAKFERGVSVPLSELPEELQENVEDPPPSVERVRKEMERQASVKNRLARLKKKVLKTF